MGSWGGADEVVADDVFFSLSECKEHTYKREAN